MHIKFWKRIWTCFIILCITSVQTFSLSAENTAKTRIVKVGVYNNTTYAYQDSSGIWRGMDVECMIAVAQKEGFQVEFIDSTNDPDFMENLDNGTYDAVADIIKTEARQQNYLFSDNAIGNFNTILSVRADDSRWDYGNAEQLSRMKIGIITSYATNKAFRTWCTGHAVTPELIEYHTFSDMLAGMQKGEIDGMLHATALDEASRSVYRTIMKLLPDAYYFAFRKNDTELKNMFDEGLGLILSANVDFLTGLKTKYEAQFEANVLPFSSKEKTYLADHSVMHVAVVNNDQPYYKVINGKATGILPDYYALVGEAIGCTFEFDAFDTDDEAVYAVSTGQSDILGIFSGGMIPAYQNGIALTDPYATVTNILLTKTGVDPSSIQSIAVKKRPADVLEAATKSLYPDAQVKEYTTADQCFNAMQNGETDAAMMGLPSSTYVMNQTNSTRYNVIPVSDVLLELCAGVKADNQILCSILNKGVSQTKGRFNGISTKNTLPENTLQSTISRLPYRMILITGSIMMALIIGLVWALFILRGRQKERAAILNQQAEVKVQKAQLDALRENAEEKNQFFANISHDMRTPLNAITGFIQLAQKESITEQQRQEYLKKAENSSGLLLDLINDTLTVSKMSSGKLKLQLTSCRTSELLNAIVTPIKAEADKKKIHFHIDVDKIQERTVLADKLNIEKIFLNLLSNAVKYTREYGNVWLTIQEEPGHDHEIIYTTIIKDDGIGIGEGFQKHIFEPFAQEKRTGYESLGTGLGLSIVKHLVDLMHGTITLESRINEGSTFTVKLAMEETEMPERVCEPPVSSQLVELSGCHVLLCEDNALNREIALALLNDKGMIVDTAEDGLIGVQKFHDSTEGQYDLILMDIRMPHLNGLDATRKIRQMTREDARSIPILAMTADAFADDIQKCLDAGMNGHIAKPINTQVFFTTIQTALQRKREPE